MRNLILSTVLLSTSYVAVAQTTTVLPLQEAIDKAAYQAVLTQSIAKAYLCSSLDIQKERQETLLSQSIQLFDYQLEQLQQQSYSNAIRVQLKKIDQLWEGYKFICGGVPGSSNALLVLEYNTNMLHACNQLTQLVQQHADNNTDYQQEVVYTSPTTRAEEQRTLWMQRMVLYALANHYQLGNAADNKATYSKAAQNFKELLGKDGSTPAHDFEQNLTALVDGGAESDSQALLEALTEADNFLFPLEELLSQQEYGRQ